MLTVINEHDQPGCLRRSTCRQGDAHPHLGRPHQRWSFKESVRTFAPLVLAVAREACTVVAISALSVARTAAFATGEMPDFLSNATKMRLETFPLRCHP